MSCELLAQTIDPSRVLTRPINRIAFASDASVYRMVPQAVVLARGVEEIQALFRFSQAHRIPMTFRAAGTSLSGQAVTDGILVEVARYWREARVEAGGRRIRVQPGVIGGHVNRMLAPFRARIGPDPASINACMMGGILANNSSGMCCGVEQNAYHTLRSLTFVLPSGTVIDTAAADADELFRAREPRLAEGLLQLRAEILASSALCERIRAKYRRKNTSGYSLNAFLDFERPVDIFRHLLIGSEGTLGFIAEAVLDTVPDLPVKYTGLLLFGDLYEACAAIVPLREAGARALELMDRASLRTVEHLPTAPRTTAAAGVRPRVFREDAAASCALLPALTANAAGLLAEFQCADETDRPALAARADASVADLHLPEPARFTHDPMEQAALWKIRSGLFPSVGSVRRSGTSVIIEDVVFPVERLADAVLDLEALFAKHGYDNAIVFGHAKDGNLHFVITQSFNHQQAVDQYARLMDDVVRLVVERYDGALKGEHGTGRNMAPFVETEWGAEAYGLMKRVKELADPDNLLNPGVIVNPDPLAHVHHLKSLPTVEEEVDKCIECGFCEVHCPSRDLTLTPRQRIVVRREMARRPDSALDADFPYMALDTCAADGLCATACPVGIDTGALTKRLRRERHSTAAHEFARFLASHFGLVERGARLALRSGFRDLPRPARHRHPRTASAGAEAVYFPACISRVFGRLRGEGKLRAEPDDFSLVEVFLTVAARAGVAVFIPPDLTGVCCGVPFSSKGYDRAYELAVNRAIGRMWRWSDAGRLPVVVDTSPCAYSLRTCREHLTPEHQQHFDGLQILDSVRFAHDTLLPRLTITHPLPSVVLHPVCSLIKLGLVAELKSIAAACSQEAVIPPGAGCCGFAGDRGYLAPELTASATRQEAAEVRAGNFDGHYSSSRTCEIGLTRATGSIYRSYLYLVEQATRP
jgi:D-lactate dehydrogenase